MTTTMLTLLVVFVGLVAFALLGQMVALWVMSRKVNSLVTRLNPLLEEAGRVVPGLLREIQGMVGETRGKVVVVATNLAEITTMARNQVERADVALSEFADRLRLQMVRVDEAIGGAVTGFEHLIRTVQETVVRPVQEVNALINGVKTGIDFFFRRRSSPMPSNRPSAYQDEEMFI